MPSVVFFRLDLSWDQKYPKSLLKMSCNRNVRFLCWPICIPSVHMCLGYLSCLGKRKENLTDPVNMVAFFPL